MMSFKRFFFFMKPPAPSFAFVKVFSPLSSLHYVSQNDIVNNLSSLISHPSLGPFMKPYCILPSRLLLSFINSWLLSAISLPLSPKWTCFSLLSLPFKKFSKLILCLLWSQFYNLTILYCCHLYSSHLSQSDYILFTLFSMIQENFKINPVSQWCHNEWMILYSLISSSITSPQFLSFYFHLLLLFFVYFIL